MIEGTLGTLEEEAVQAGLAGSLEPSPAAFRNRSPASRTWAAS